MSGIEQSERPLFFEAIAQYNTAPRHWSTIKQTVRNLSNNARGLRGQLTYESIQGYLQHATRIALLWRQDTLLVEVPEATTSGTIRTHRAKSMEKPTAKPTRIEYEERQVWNPIAYALIQDKYDPHRHVYYWRLLAVLSERGYGATLVQHVQALAQSTIVSEIPMDVRNEEKQYGGDPSRGSEHGNQAIPAIAYIALFALPSVIHFYRRLGFQNTFGCDAELPEVTHMAHMVADKRFNTILGYLEDAQYRQFLELLMRLHLTYQRDCGDLWKCQEEGFAMSWCVPRMGHLEQEQQEEQQEEKAWLAEPIEQHTENGSPNQTMAQAKLYRHIDDDITLVYSARVLNSLDNSKSNTLLDEALTTVSFLLAQTLVASS